MMTEFRKRLILNLADGDMEALRYIHMLEKLKQREFVYQWMIEHNIKGRKIKTLFEENRYSLLRVSKYLLSKIEHKEKKAIISGIDM